jgi:transposase InsO family protein
MRREKKKKKPFEGHEGNTGRDRPTGRFDATTKSEACKQVDGGRTLVEVAKQYGMHPNTLGNWLKQREQARAQGQDDRSGLMPKSTRPLYSPSPVSDEVRDKVLEAKREHPEMGPAQLRNHLRRFERISLSHKIIGKILRQAGIPLEKRVRDEEERVLTRFEMTRPNELWMMDVKSFFVHDLKVYLLTALDDYSRLVVDHELLNRSSSQAAIALVKRAIQRHGKPERVLTDRGGEFHSWQGVSVFTRFLEEEGIEHSLARPHHPQTCGKIEALHGTLDKELIGRVRFDGFLHAKREIAGYYEHYNFGRTHMGIGGVTPADRYFGRLPQILSEIERQSPSSDGRARLPGERAVVLQIALVDGKLELFFAGKRVALG